MMGITGDQQRFLTAHFISLSLALPYRFIPQRLRNYYNFIPGIALVYYCFGRQANSFLLFSLVSFLASKYSPREHVQRISMCISLGFLSFTHLSRQIFDYGGYKIDISGPYMIAVQKITSLGFCIHDGYLMETSEKCKTIKHTSHMSSISNEDQENNNNLPDNLRKLTKSVESYDSETISGSRETTKQLTLTDEQVRYAVRKKPNLIEFLGYFFHFPSLLCGPFMYYNDYQDFVDYPQNESLPPGRFTTATKKIVISITCTILMLNLMPKFDVSILTSTQFLVYATLLEKYLYILVFTMVSRLKYYVAWNLGEAASNISGFGFNGYDENKKPKWDLIANMDLAKFETCLNLRDAIHSWNKTTQTWLRRTAYERVQKKYAVLATYCLSAIWHGFYPGYYMTFLGGALFTYAARIGRRIFRPMFQRGQILPRIYDTITFVLTRLALAYLAFPFVVLDFKNNIAIYRSLYYSLHVLAISLIILGQFVKRK